VPESDTLPAEAKLLVVKAKLGCGCRCGGGGGLEFAQAPLFLEHVNAAADWTVKLMTSVVVIRAVVTTTIAITGSLFSNISYSGNLIFESSNELLLFQEANTFKSILHWPVWHSVRYLSVGCLR